jgi:two-component system CheB/CheR fusion protein
VVGNGTLALALTTGRKGAPDLILADYNLPDGPNGLQLIVRLREKFRCEIPAIILTGDISSSTQQEIARHRCLQLNKPLKLKELTQVVQRLLPVAAAPPPHVAVAAEADAATIFIVDDDPRLRQALRSVLEDDGRIVEDYADCESFLAAYRPGREACLLIDAYLPGMSGLNLLRRLGETGQHLPAIMITGNSDVPMAVEAMKAGASDFIEKPVSRADLLASVSRALEQARDSSKLLAWREDAASHMAGLTARQRQIMDLVLAGHPSKNIAADLGISQRTVENHRASIMKRTGSKSLPALARLALAAASTKADGPQG